jgi:hypothetical protein
LKFWLCNFLVDKNINARNLRVIYKTGQIFFYYRGLSPELTTDINYKDHQSNIPKFPSQSLHQECLLYPPCTLVPNENLLLSSHHWVHQLLLPCCSVTLPAFTTCVPAGWETISHFMVSSKGGSKGNSKNRKSLKEIG